MKSNVNATDRITRVLLAAIVAVLYLTNVITGTLGIVLLIAAGVILLTSIINFCPIYYMLGLSTHSKKV